MPLLSRFPYVTKISFNFSIGLPSVAYYTLSDIILRSTKGSFFLSLLFAAFSVFLSNDSLYAEERLTKKGISLPGEPCRVAPYSDWTNQEKWVWKRVCEREPADFNTVERYGGNLKSNEPEGWPLNRQLRVEFLETILSHEPYRSAIPRQGVQIVGAWFREPFNLTGLKIDKLLLLNECRFDKDVNLVEFQSTSSLLLRDSTFNGGIDMSGMQLAGDFDSLGSRFKSVDLRAAKIGRVLLLNYTIFDDTLNMMSSQAGDTILEGANLKTVLMNNAKIGNLLIVHSIFQGPLDMTGLRTENHVIINSSILKGVTLMFASIGGQFGIINSSFDGELLMNLMQVKGHAILGNNSNETASPNRFKEIDMSNARVGGQLFLERAIFYGPVILKSLHVGEDLSLRNAIALTNQIDLSYANISGNADITSGAFVKLNLTGATIRGELRFESGPKWGGNSSMILRNASVGAIQDDKNGWPDNLELDGFVYEQLGSLVDGSSDSMTDREEAWLIDWLERQKSYSPQPYSQLSYILTNVGRGDKARAILYSGKERSRAQALIQARWGEWLWLSLQNIFIGYGYKIYYALIWALLFIGIGALVFRGSIESKEHRMPYGIAYSFDMLLPIIKLRQKHYDVDLSGWRRYYFFVHKMMGYVLASFLIAGLAGMVK